MLTIQALQDLGVNTKDGMARCLNNEQFYFRMLTTALGDDSCEKLAAAIEANDLDKAFELAHALKGVMGNLALTPIYDPVNEMLELLRSRTQMDYSPYIKTILEKKQALSALL